ncbi:MAG: ROK family protein [Chlamydiota bacterium]|nr:ROK family protein [Chlamydiota bacterium]
MSRYLGLDIGGTKLSLSLGDKSGHILREERIPTPSPKEAMLWIQKKVVSWQPESLVSMGVLCPGPFEWEKGSFGNPPNLPGWESFSLYEELRGLFDFPIHLASDAIGGALAQWNYSPLKEPLVYLTLSTGLGVGVIANGQPLMGRGVPEAGHIVIEKDGPLCACGQRGCFEAYCGGLATQNRLLHSQGISGWIREVRAGNPIARKEWDEWILRLAQGVGALIMAYAPGRCVLGTLAQHAGDVLMHPLKERLPHFCWPSLAKDCNLLINPLGDRVAPLGALAIASRPLP